MLQVKDRDGRPERDEWMEILKKILLDESKAYVPNSMPHASLLTAKMTQANSWRTHPRNGYVKLEVKRKQAKINLLEQGTTQTGSNAKQFTWAKLSPKLYLTKHAVI